MRASAGQRSSASVTSARFKLYGIHVGTSAGGSGLKKASSWGESAGRSEAMRARSAATAVSMPMVLSSAAICCWMIERISGHDSLGVVLTKRELAAILARKLDFEGAAREYAEALDILRKGVGNEHPMVKDLERHLEATRRIIDAEKAAEKEAGSGG